MRISTHLVMTPYFTTLNKVKNPDIIDYFSSKGLPLQTHWENLYTQFTYDDEVYVSISVSVSLSVCKKSIEWILILEGRCMAQRPIH